MAKKIKTDTEKRKTEDDPKNLHKTYMIMTNYKICIIYLDAPITKLFRLDKYIL